MIGNKIYYLDTKDKAVKDGQIIGINLSDTGYTLYSILDDNRITDNRITVEEAHCYNNIDDAEAHSARVLPIIARAEAVKDKAQAEVDALRIEVIGEPIHRELALIVTGGK